MKNSLVVCGGTGAHVALAMVRLHTLGYALGFFRSPEGKPVGFPTLYLVDQDSGDGTHRATAWQEVRRLIDGHPARYDWHATTGLPDPPKLRVVTPLPIGIDKNWFDPPYDTLGRRFTDSRYLDLLTSRDQCEIQFSQGMMGSPAVGALLFRLKRFDTKPGGGNHDDAYHELMSERGRIVVAGSAVGGTGAAVAPTLAQQLAETKADVMAVMVLNWFRFDADGLEHATIDRAQRRDRSMIENANSAFAYYGRNLANHVATVPVGMPSTAVASRRYTSDTQQPTFESFVHGVAALSGLHHFLAEKPYQPGLYQMGAEDPALLGGGNILPGRSHDALQSLANQAATLAETLDVCAKVLFTSQRSGWFDVVPALHEHLGRLAAPERAGQAVRDLADAYRQHVNWMRDVLGIKPRPSYGLLREGLSRTRLAKHPIETSPHDGFTPEEDLALTLFHWTAEWIRDCRNEIEGLVVQPAHSAGGGYWPSSVGQDSLNVSAEQAGGLTRVAEQNVLGTVDGFILEESVTENGWPDPLAAADYFRYAIEQGNRTAYRQLAMLLVGVVSGKLTLREVGRSPGLSHQEVSLDRWVDSYREEHTKDFACVKIVYSRADGETVLGFNSPHTLFCPVPAPDSDETLARIWAELSATLTGSELPVHWETEEMDSWLPAGKAIRQIRSWIDREKQVHGGTSPPWTHIFESESALAPETFGTGRKLAVYWGTGTDAQCIEIALPTTRSGNYWPNDKISRITEDVMLQHVPEIRKLRTEQIEFDRVEFELPDREEPVRAFWREHLEQLQQRGRIAAFGDKPDERRLALLMADGSKASVLKNVIVLDRERIMIRSCSPMQQDPVPGSSTSPERYPDYPLRADYFGLVQTDDGRNVLDVLRRGEAFKVTPPVIDDRPRDRVATWDLHLRGRSQPLQITLPVPQDGALHKAHWMVWPRFRSMTKPIWRAYYVYEHCTDARIHLSTLWLDPDTDHLRQCDAPAQGGSHPIRFAAGDRREHTGGPPVAFSAENTETDQELGLYVVSLDRLSEQDASVKVGIDFGTSHTVASVQAHGQKALVQLAPELDSTQEPLTLHVSENWSHVTEEEDGLQTRALWLPTYVRTTLRGAAGLLPSELLTIRPLTQLTAADVSEWQPGRDCVIPFMDMQRQDLADHLLADFKWDVSFPAFRGREPILREIYLGMVTELVMADIVWRRLRALPGRQVDFTFTYPLRTPAGQIEGYERTLRRVMGSATRSLGFRLGLTDGIGIYNESRAAKGGTLRFGEVCLVGDLGGGTLDLFISANTGPRVEFKEVADSARLGGNQLLRTIAQHAERFLPKNGGWSESPGEIETKLRAWMRSLGSPRLFGTTADEAEHHSGLNVRGFDKPSDANVARALINRYFRLLQEYMARSLVAFLARHWCRETERAGLDLNALRVLVQLRGNGWRLWHDTVDYQQIETSVAEYIQKRARMLWETDELWWDVSDPKVGAPDCGSGGSSATDPKVAPILEAVGKALAHSEVDPYSYALVELQLLRSLQSAGDGQPNRIRWFDGLPFRTGGNKELQVEFHAVRPPIPLSHEHEVTATYLDDLEPDLKKEVNAALQESGVTNEVDFRAPTAALVWEAAFRSKRFLGDE